MYVQYFNKSVNFLIIIYMYKKRLLAPTYVPVSLFHVQTAGPISAKFWRDLSTNSGNVLNTSMTKSNRPPDPRVPLNSKT